MRVILFLFISLFPLLAAHGQEQQDSLFVGKENLPEEAMPAGTSFGVGVDETLPLVPYSASQAANDGVSLPVFRNDSLPRFSLKGALYRPYTTHPSPMHRGDYGTSGVLLPMRTGALYGSGGQETLPGIGLFNSATLGYRQRLGDKLSMQLSLDATKMTMTHLTGQRFSTSGSLEYRVADNLSFTAFGTYNLGRGYGMGTHRYGGTANLRVSDNFYMRMGVQRIYNMYTGRWETVPIAIPIIRVGDVALGGLDVGGLLYSILHETVIKRRSRAFEPANPAAPAPGGGRGNLPKGMDFRSNPSDTPHQMIYPMRRK